MRKSLFFIPFVLFIALAAFLFSGLFSDPRQHGSALVSKPLPAFLLPDLMAPQRMLSADDLKGKVYLLNVWGLWCPTCNAELGFLTELRQQGIEIVGLYYVQPQDSAFGETFDLAALQKDVAKKLAEQGNPYQLNILDEKRSLIFDLGVTGAPETFLIDAQGQIRAHHVGDINPQNWPALAAQYQAVLQEAQAAAALTQQSIGATNAP
ncbi:redoxin family protein [Rheinheimera sp. 4Y26]|uniref:redoxin family protein n=1 Tax=Rheinheimera sp. 4Y26 TaxID=2977811 RepID=UPI0021B1494F|nr:redoxin family protein [Rheinheimera sp. 4Y26]MCT6699568.1 redoxin family protein [Rheinheimera sp. 4Y26]